MQCAVTVTVLVLGLCWGSWVEASHRSVRQLFPQSQPDCGSGFKCIPLRQCQVFRDILVNPTPDVFRRLRESHCGFDDRIPLNCCPERAIVESQNPTVDNRPTLSPSRPQTTSRPIITPPPTPPPTLPPTPPPTQPTPSPTQPIQPPTQTPDKDSLLPARCGLSSAGQTRIFFGEDSPLGAYPWIALLGYTSRFQPQVVWGCGGSLINSRYVVTASHCTAEEFTFNRDLTVIRLGEHNLSTEIDCETRGGRRTCAPPFQTFTPVEVIRHADFNARGTVSDDIALIRLDKDAEFNAFVGPICLPPSTMNPGDFLGNRQAFVAGWGATERGPDTEILQQVRIPFVSRDECNPHYNNALLNEQICFGGDGRRDSCFGDSGGPVVAPAPGGGDFLLLALVSFGQPSCGVEGVPAVYTSLASYRQWILDNIKP